MFFNARVTTPASCVFATATEIVQGQSKHGFGHLYRNLLPVCEEDGRLFPICFLIQINELNRDVVLIGQRGVAEVLERLSRKTLIASLRNDNLFG